MGEHHRRIVEAAARLLRQKGFDEIGVDEVMQQAGLTHGGFYRHFASKDALSAAALSVALERNAARQSRFDSLGAVVADYLTQRHRNDRAHGCAIAALGCDVVRQGRPVRAVLTKHVRAQLDRFAALLRGGRAASKRRRAIATLAGMVGALTLARAVDDPVLADEILTAARETLSGPVARPAAVAHNDAMVHKARAAPARPVSARPVSGRRVSARPV